jgi:poly(A) polymerase Pap1
MQDKQNLIDDLMVKLDRSYKYNSDNERNTIISMLNDISGISKEEVQMLSKDCGYNQSDECDCVGKFCQYGK